MHDLLADLRSELGMAIRGFWLTRDGQANKQGAGDPLAKDRGQRGAVTAGKHFDGIVGLIFRLLITAGVSGATIYCRARPSDEVAVKKKKRSTSDPPLCTQTRLPGWFRAEKEWDLIVVVAECLIAAIECKSQVGSFSNNMNNRAEEAIGIATDVWAAFREGAFKPSTKPWLGFLMLLEEAPAAMSPVKTHQPHFAVFPEFLDTSYADRYEILLTRLIRERLYDHACLLLTSRKTGLRGEYREPSAELSFEKFVQSLLAKVIAVAATQPAVAIPALPVIEYTDEPSPDQLAPNEVAAPTDDS